MKNTTDEESILRQVAIPNGDYTEVKNLTNEHNTVHHLVKRAEKTHIQDMLPLLVHDGIDARRGRVYLPDHINGDPKAKELHGIAQAAVDKLQKYITA